MFNLEQAIWFLREAGIILTVDQLKVFLQTKEIENGVYDSSNDSWSVSQSSLEKYIRNRAARRRRLSAVWGAGFVAAVAALGNLAGNLSDISEFTCSRFAVFCEKKPDAGVLPLFAVKLSPIEGINCPVAYQVPDSDKSKVLSLMRKTDSNVDDIIKQVDAPEKYQFIGSRNVYIRLTGQNIKDKRPVIGKGIRFEIKRIGDGPAPAVTLYMDECGGGLEDFSFRWIDLRALESEYFISAQILNSEGKVAKLQIESGEAIEIIGLIRCIHAGTYSVRALLDYDLETVGQTPVLSNTFNILCPNSILALNELIPDRRPREAKLIEGYYQWSYAP